MSRKTMYRGDDMPTDKHKLSVRLHTIYYCDVVAQFTPKPVLKPYRFAACKRKQFFGEIREIESVDNVVTRVTVRNSRTNRNRKIDGKYVVGVHRVGKYLRKTSDNTWFKVMLNGPHSSTLRQVYTASASQAVARVQNPHIAEQDSADTVSSEDISEGLLKVCLCP